MEDVMLKREAATEFLQPRDRRSSLECWPSEAGDISGTVSSGWFHFFIVLLTHLY